MPHFIDPAASFGGLHVNEKVFFIKTFKITQTYLKMYVL